MKPCPGCGHTRQSRDDSGDKGPEHCPECGGRYNRIEAYRKVKQLAQEDARRRTAETSKKEPAPEAEEKVRRETEEARKDSLVAEGRLCPLCREAPSAFTIKNKKYCKACAKQVIKSRVVLTTTPDIAGRRIKYYIDVDSVQVMVGAQFFEDLTADSADLYGTREGSLHQALQEAKTLAFNKLRYKAFQRDGNAVVGVRLRYTPFSPQILGLVVSGTIVKTAPAEWAEVV